MKIIVFYLLAIPIACLSSQGDGSIGARSISLGGASTCLFDVWATQNNQGSLGFLKQTEFGTVYENRFLVKELSRTGFAFASPLKKGTFGICYSNFGYKLFRQNQTTLSYGLLVNKIISVGIGLEYLNTKIGDVYGQSHNLLGSIGMTVKVLSNLNIASHIYNPFRSKIAQYNDERIPTIMKIGLQYTFSQKVFIAIEAEKTTSKNINLKTGIEYNPTGFVFLRIGVSSFPSQACFGVGVNYHQLKIDLSTCYNNVLGISPQIGLSYFFDKKANKKEK